MNFANQKRLAWLGIPISGATMLCLLLMALFTTIHTAAPIQAAKIDQPISLPQHLATVTARSGHIAPWQVRVITDAQTITNALILTDGLLIAPAGHLTATERLTVANGVTVLGSLLAGDKLALSGGMSIVEVGSVTATRGISIADGVAISGTLMVSGGMAAVSGGMVIAEKGIVTATQGISVADSIIVAGSLVVSGGLAAISNGMLILDSGTVTVIQGVVVSDQTKVAGTLFAQREHAEFGGLQIEETGAITTSQGITISKGATVAGALQTALGYIDSAGLTIFETGTLSVTQELTVVGQTAVSGTLSTGGGLTAWGIVNIYDTGSVTVSQRLSATQAVTVLGTLVAQNGVSVDGGFSSLFEVGCQNIRVVTGNDMITEPHTLTQARSVLGSLTAVADLTVPEGLNVTEQLTVGGSLTVRPEPRYYLCLPYIANRINVFPTSNSGFEHGSLLWDEFSQQGQQLIKYEPDLGVPPHSGRWAAQLGNYDQEISMISQGVTLLEGQSCLGYWQWTVSNDACFADFGGVGIDGEWEAAHSLCAGTATGRWVQQTVTLTKYVSKPFVLNFAVVNDYSVPSTMYVDDIAFYPDDFCRPNTSRQAQMQAAAANSKPEESVHLSLDWLIGQPITQTRSFIGEK